MIRERRVRVKFGCRSVTIAAPASEAASGGVPALPNAVADTTHVPLPRGPAIVYLVTSGWRVCRMGLRSVTLTIDLVGADLTRRRNEWKSAPASFEPKIAIFLVR